MSVPVVLEEEKYLQGYICRFNTESNPLYDVHVCKTGPFVEVVKPGAFTRTLRENLDIPALVNHQMSAVLGRTSSGTLNLYEDSEGLAFRVELPDTTLGHDTREQVRRGDIRGCSFGMYVMVDELLVRQEAPVLRTVFDVDLFEVSPACTIPAYTSSEVELRELQIQEQVSHSVRFPRIALARRVLLLED